MNFTTVFADGSVLDYSKQDIGTTSLTNLLTCIGKENRYANVIDWTVLEHSLACGYAASMLFGNNIPLMQFAYFHDIHEAIIRDVPSPFKALVGDSFYKVENTIQSKTLAMLGVNVSVEDKEMFKEIDSTMGFVEALKYHSQVKTIQMLSSDTDYNPITVAICTEAIIAVENKFPQIFAENGELHPEITKIFKEVLALHIN
jgi:hypothetical protein